MIILASASAVRARLLRDAGVSCTVATPDVDEVALKAELLAAGAGPREIAARLSEAKALSLAAAPDDFVIGADQTLDLDGGLVDKAADLAEIRARLLNLRGRAHTLHAATALARGGTILWRGMASPQLRMRAFSDAFLDDYLAAEGAAVLSSVGCYRLEGMGVQLFEAIDGDYFAVLGLPLVSLLAALRQAGGLSS
ncbi:MAG TPA: Maf family protein [Caulobacteraceae bacterium]|nr:Maf family protein [Caulobacteraceae bacterium]